MNNTMEVKQTLKCGLHSPEKWQEDYNGWDADDRNNLPDANPISIHAVDEYPACPDNWEHGSDIAGSYFAGLQEDWALWLDFNECFNHTHDVAVVLSVQGVNPITGQTMIGDNPLRMEQYHKNCPVHNIAFKQDYFCEECGFNWPAQNYLSTTGTPYGMFWLDGFRSPDGKVRQYIISAEKMRSVAAQVMEQRGEDAENRVFAIGMAFYLSKAKKPDMPKREPVPTGYEQFGGNVGQTQPLFFSPQHNARSWGGKLRGRGTSYSSTSSSSSRSRSRGGAAIRSLRDQSLGGAKAYCAGGPSPSFTASLGDTDTDGMMLSASINSVDSLDSIDINDMVVGSPDMELAAGAAEMPIETVTPVKKLEVGAGALVSQLVYDDPKNLKKYWETTPAGMIYLNYCDEITLKKILDAGKVASKKDGFMQGIQVGG